MSSILQCFSQLLPFLVSAHHTLNSPTAGDSIYIENIISITIVILYIDIFIALFSIYLQIISVSLMAPLFCNVQSSVFMDAQNRLAYFLE